MTLLDWLSTVLGRRVTAELGEGGECVDLANDYLTRVLHVRHQFRNAVDWAGIGIQATHWEDNSSSNYPSAGAIVVWHADVPSVGIGPYGHIAIVLLADPMHLLTCDQNWPTGARSTLVLHSYVGVAGWHGLTLHPAP